MFYDVRVFDGQGKLKQIVTSEMSSMRHWEKFSNLQFNPKSPLTGESDKRKILSRIRREYQDLDYAQD